MVWCSYYRDRFRTTVNVLGDSFGVGIVQHYSRKQLSKIPLTTGIPLVGNSSTVGEARLDPDSHVAPPTTEPLRSGEASPRSDYGTASPPPPSLPIIPTPQWSLSSYESSRNGTTESGRARKEAIEGAVDSTEKPKEESNL